MEGDFSNSAGVRPDRGFDFNFHVGRLCADLASRLPELGHVDMSARGDPLLPGPQRGIARVAGHVDAAAVRRRRTLYPAPAAVGRSSGSTTARAARCSTCSVSICRGF